MNQAVQKPYMVGKDQDKIDHLGYLQIAGFELSHFHPLEEIDSVDPNNVDVIHFPTYAPPETSLHAAASRSFDIWSLACLYLEFISWMLIGSTGLDEFSDARSEFSSEYDMQDDYFYTIFVVNGVKVAKVRHGVKDWVEGLHGSPLFSTVIRDLLNLIMDNLFVIDSKEWVKISDIYEQLRLIPITAELDTKFVLGRPTTRKMKSETTGLSKSRMPSQQKSRTQILPAKNTPHQQRHTLRELEELHGRMPVPKQTRSIVSERVRMNL